MSSWSGVYIFRRHEFGWVEETKLVSPDGAVENGFGTSLAIDGGVLIVGADRDDQAALEAGAAYIFSRTPEGVWSAIAKLIAPDAGEYHWFGHSVAVAGDYVLVGSPYDHSGSASGSVHVFHFEGGAWTHKLKLVPNDNTAGDGFGYSLVLQGEHAAIGAPYRSDPAPYTGAVYIWGREGTNWVQEAKLTPASAGEGDLVGFIMALYDDRLFLGDNTENENGPDSGVVYTFLREGTTWIETPRIHPPEPEHWDGFGASVAADGVYALFARPGDVDNGSVYVYAFSGDCDVNGEVDACEIAGTPSLDVDADGTLDVCQEPVPIPMLSTWGVIVSSLLTLSAGCVILRTRRIARRLSVSRERLWSSKEISCGGRPANA